MSENDYDTVESVDWGWNKSLLTFISTFLHFLQVLSCDILQLLVFSIICMVIVQTLCCVFSVEVREGRLRAVAVSYLV